MRRLLKISHRPALPAHLEDGDPGLVGGEELEAEDGAVVQGERGQPRPRREVVLCG